MNPIHYMLKYLCAKTSQMPPSFCNIILERKRYNRTLCAFYSYARQSRKLFLLSILTLPVYLLHLSLFILSFSLSLSLSVLFSFYIYTMPLSSSSPVYFSRIHSHFILRYHNHNIHCVPCQYCLSSKLFKNDKVEF